MRCLGRLIAFFLVLAIIFVTPGVLWLVAVWNVWQDADEYTNALDQDTYDELSVLVLPVFAYSVSNIAEPNDENQILADKTRLFADTITSFERDEWEPIVEDEIDPLWVEEFITVTLDSTLEYWRYETDRLNLVVDLQPVADMLEGQSGERLVADMVATVGTWEACGTSELFEFEDFLDYQTNNLPRCDPGEENLAELEDSLDEARRIMVAELRSLPNYQFDLRRQLAIGTTGGIQQVDKEMHNTRRGFFAFDRALIVLLLFPVLLFSIIIMVTVRSAKEFFLWAGLPLIGVAVLTLLPLIPWMYGLLGQSSNSPSIPGSDSEFRLGFELQGLLFSALSPELLGASLVLLVLGFIMLILAAIVRNPPAQQAQQVYYVLPGGGQQPIPYPTGQYVPTGGSSTPTPAYVPTPPGKRSPKPQKPSQTPPRPPMDYIQTGAPRSGRPPGATPRRAQDHEDVDQSVPVEVITPTPVPGSKTPSGVDRFKDDLEQSDIPNDQTFIPGEQPSSDPGDSESDQ